VAEIALAIAFNGALVGGSIGSLHLAADQEIAAA
jgi:hypothetical protein